ncbi:MAG TPA: hypothetical protein VGC95_07820 [Chitinophagaceae bacterium]|jgi:hypothetical protein
MTTIVKNGLAVLFICSVLVTGCKKDKMVPPTIEFKTGNSYISADAHLAVNTAFTVGIDAKRTEKEDDLKTFVITRSYDGAAETTVATETLTADQAGEFEKDYPFTTRNQAGTEKYSFIVTNRDGLITTKSITISVP